MCDVVVGRCVCPAAPAAWEELVVLEVLELELVELELELELVLVLDELEDDDVEELEELDDVVECVTGLKVTPVNTTCNNQSVGWPEYDVCTVVA